MKNYVLAINAALWLLCSHCAHSEIVNGFANDLALANQSLENLKTVLKATHDETLIKCVQRYLRMAERKRDDLYKQYRSTQALLNRFKSIDPQTYAAINSITDFEGHPTDIYVKVVKRGEMETSTMAGTTNLAQSSQSQHCYRSAYGDRSVSISICYGTQSRLLRTLAHEFGHVMYQVPNLRAYMEYYKMTYSGPQGEGRGHNLDDPSHQSVLTTMGAFRASRKNYNKEK